MPELPEVELVRRGLTATIVGRCIEAVEVRSPKTMLASPETLKRSVLQRSVTAVGRRGKVLIVDLDGGAHLLVHLMMTGQFVLSEGDRALFTGGHPSRSMLGPMPNLTTRVIFRLAGDRTLHFNDGRLFARMRVLDDAGLAADPFLRRLGPEPLGDRFTAAGLRAQLERHPRAPIKGVILDQSVVAGVGNIYANEALHLARIHPARPAGSLTAVEARRLHRAIRRILALAVETGATSRVEYTDHGQAATGYLARARVFQREGQPCSVCGTAIERIRVVGRATDICPRCQAIYISDRGPATRQSHHARGARAAAAV